MKNSIKLICAAAMTAGLFSCAKNATIETPSPYLTPATIRVSADDVKSTLSGGTLTWTTGDEIAVYQYKNYGTDKQRDAKKNIFTFSSGNKFTGSIAGYMPTEEGGDPERFYVAYPAANCSACGITTGKYKIDIPSEQTGLLSDFGKNATYLGSLNGKSEPVTSYEGGVLTFLKPFTLYCATPVLKFNVPAALNLTKITISLKDESDAPVAAAGQIQCRSDAKDNFNAVTTSNTVEIYNGGNVISGDVYAVIAPTDCPEVGVFTNGAKKIIFDLENGSATASIKLSLTGEITSGKIKVLPSLPTDIQWDLPVGPGISLITMSDPSGNAGKFLITPEESTSTIKYGRSVESLGAIEDATSTYSTGINSAGSPASDADATEGVVFTKLKVQTEGYSDYCASAMTWPFSNKKGFAYNAMRHPFASATTGLTVTFFGLTFTIGDEGGTGANLYPYCNTAGMNIMWKPTGTNPQTNPQGYLSFVAPETGNAYVYMDGTVEKNTKRTFTIKKGDTPVASFNSGEKNTTKAEERAWKSAGFAVTAGDVITVSLNASLNLHSLTFLWEPEVSK